MDSDVIKDDPPDTKYVRLVLMSLPPPSSPDVVDDRASSSASSTRRHDAVLAVHIAAGCHVAPTTGAFKRWPAAEPWNPALPNVKTPPSAAISQ